MRFFSGFLEKFSDRILKSGWQKFRNKAEWYININSIKSGLNFITAEIILLSLILFLWIEVQNMNRRIESYVLFQWS